MEEKVIEMKENLVVDVKVVDAKVDAKVDVKVDAKDDQDMVNIRKKTLRNLEARRNLNLDFSKSNPNKLKRSQKSLSGLNLSGMEMIEKPKHLADRRGCARLSLYIPPPPTPQSIPPTPPAPFRPRSFNF